MLSNIFLQISQPLIDMNCIESHPSKPLDHCRSFFIITLQSARCFFLSWEEFALHLAMKPSHQASVVFIPASPGWSHQDRSSTHIVPHFWKHPFCSEVRRSTTSAQCPESKRSSSWTNRSTQDHGCGLHYIPRKA